MQLAALERVEADLLAGNLEEVPLVWPDGLATADAPGRKRTAVLGVRTFDLLHAAAAVSLKAKTFLTFDGRQLALARAAGLRPHEV